jgi:hypothetical protein
MADEILSGLKGIKQELRAVQDQMAGLDAGSQEFVKLSQKAGELRDRMKDVAEAVNANAGPAIGSFGNNLSIARGQLGELDITGFGESMKRMGANVKAVSFKDMGEGLKSVTGGFATLGKALLTNPLFLLATAVLGIVANFEKLTKAGGLVGKIFGTIGDFVNSAKEAFFAFTDAIGLTDMKADELAEKQKARNEKLKADSKTLNDELNKQREDNYKRTLSDRDREIRETTAKYQRLWELANGNAKKEKEINAVMNEELAQVNDKYDKLDAEKRKAAAEKKRLEEEKRKKETIDRRKALSDFNAQQDAEDYQMALDQTEQMSKLGQDLTDKERERAIEKTEIAKTAYEELDGYDKVYVSQLLERSDEATQHQIDNAKKLRDAEFDKRDKLLKLAKEGEQAISDVGAAYFATKMSRIDKETVAGAAAYEALARKQFEFNKKMQLAGAVIDLAKSINASLASSPVAIGAVPNPAGIASLAFASATGIANIAKIAATQYQSPNAQSSTSPSPSGGGGAAMSAPTAQSPNALNLSFLEGNVNTAPLQTYVLAGQVSNAQQAEFKIKNTASILGGG